MVYSSEIMVQVQGVRLWYKFGAVGAHITLQPYTQDSRDMVGGAIKGGFQSQVPTSSLPLFSTLLLSPAFCNDLLVLTQVTDKPALCPDVFSEQDLDPLTLLHCPLPQHLSTAHGTQQVP